MRVSGSIAIDGSELLIKTLVEERMRDDIRIGGDEGLFISFCEESLSDVRSMVNSVMNDLRCAEEVMEVDKHE